MTDEVDMDELTERAKVLAEATGRSIEDVMADLLDDGILNESNHEKDEPKDLITQLKEAGASITTVQEINKEVSENKVLNGGDNKTDVKIETTLEGDIVDRAIASAQRKADDLKKPHRHIGSGLPVADRWFPRGFRSHRCPRIGGGWRG